MAGESQRHPLLEKQVKRAARFSEDGVYDLELLFDLVSETYTEQDSLRERHDRASKLMADEILAGKQFLDLIIARNPGGLFWKNRDLTFIGCNEFVLKLFGLESTGHIIGKTTAQLNLPEEYVEKYQKEEMWVVENRKPRLDTVYSYRLEGSRKETFIAISTIPLFDSQNNVIGILGVLRDITEQTLYERALEKAKEEADKANQAKSEFLANMSHELRTPLNSIMGMTRMIIEDSGLNEENREMAEIINKSALSLLSIVNDILDISKIESGSMELESIGFDPRELVSTAIEFLAPVASNKGITLHYSYEKEDMPYLVGDSFRLGRVLTNLIGNGIKYTDKGHVKVVVDYELLNDGWLELCCEVSDTGTGIPEDRLSDIFEKFIQADLSTTRRYGGTGLGLAISKELIEMMNGRIGAKNRPGRGSAFWFRVPCKITDKIDTGIKIKEKRRRRRDIIRKTAGRVPVDKARLLVAEDHKLNQEFMARMLRRMGFRHVDIQDNGVVAFQAYSKKKFDLILMDCHMPEQSGYETSMKIRDREKNTGGSIPIVALTADAMKGTREKCKQSGMDEYITKPLDTDELKDVLQQWVVFPSEKKTGAQGGMEQGEFAMLKKYASTPEDRAHLVKLFKDEGRKGIQTLKEQCKDGKNVKWEEAAHKLKGAAGMVGIEKLHVLCVEAQAMENVSAKERRDIVKRIEKEYERVCKKMEKLVKDTAGS